MAGRIRTRIVKGLGKDILAEVAEEAVRRFAEAYDPDPDSYLYRNTAASPRSLEPMTHERALDVVWELYQKNPIAHRLPELVRDFVVGDGIRYDCSNPDVGEIVNDFWNDEVNDWDVRLGDYALEESLWGEWVPEALTGEIGGGTQLGLIDPAQIKKVVQWSENPTVADQVWVKNKAAAVQGKKLDVIRTRRGTLGGDVFYNRVNGVSNSARGWSDLLHVIDWVDALDDMLWEMVERARLQRVFVWDALLEGKDDQGVAEWLKAHGKPPRSGSVLAHNEKVTWTAVSPSLGSAEIAQETDTLVSHIARGFGIPKTWLSEADDVNRATAQAMDVPTIRKFQRRQMLFLAQVQNVLRYVLDQKVQAGSLAEEVPVTDNGEPVTDENGEDVMAAPIDTVTLYGPEISSRDLNESGTFLTAVASFVAVAEQEGWFGKKTQRQTLATALASIGVDFDPADEPDEDMEPQAPEQLQLPGQQPPPEEQQPPYPVAVP